MLFRMMERRKYLSPSDIMVFFSEPMNQRTDRTGDVTVSNTSFNPDVEGAFYMESKIRCSPLPHCKVCWKVRIMPVSLSLQISLIWPGTNLFALADCTFTTVAEANPGRFLLPGAGGCFFCDQY